MLFLKFIQSEIKCKSNNGTFPLDLVGSALLAFLPFPPVRFPSGTILGTYSVEVPSG